MAESSTIIKVESVYALLVFLTTSAWVKHPSLHHAGDRRTLLIGMAKSNSLYAVFLLATFWLLVISGVSASGSSPPGCGGVFIESSGSFQSPGFPNNYPNNARCTFDIRASRHMKIALVIHSYDLESTHDKLQVKQTVSGSNSIVADLTGSKKVAAKYTSAESRFILVFRTDSSVTKRGFNASYYTFQPECGGVFSGSSGSFSSPKYPDQYPANARCNYEIRVPTNLKIVLEIHFYDLEKSFDKLRLSQMSSGSYNLVAEFTGIERTPRNYTSAENRFTLLFTSDGSGSRKGFLASYRTILACGGAFTGLSGTIASPGFPKNYPSNSNCTYDIHVPRNMKIVLKLHFIHMDTCCDRLEIKQMVSGSNNIVATLSGSHKTPMIYTSLENRFTLLFTGGRNSEYRGFRATYHAFQPGCGGVFTELSGSFYSPGYPSLYPNDAHCKYDIHVPINMKIELVIHPFYLENGSDKLELRQMVFGSNSRVAELTGIERTAMTYTSLENRFTLLFTSDDAGTRSGFRATYRAIQPGCGGVFTGSSGSFYSPGYPNNYPNNVRCRYDIYEPQGMKIILVIHFFDLESSSGKLELRQMVSGSNNVVQELTGSENIAKTYTSAENRFTLLFSSGPIFGFRSDKRGFWASYRAIRACGGVFTELSGSFQSPGYPDNYPNNARCTYDIRVPRNMKILLVIHSFDLETSDDKLELRQMVSGSNNFVTEFTGTEIAPRNYTSAENKFTLFFRSDPIDTRGGFKASYRAIGGCGGMFTGLSGSFDSPGYPHNYPNNANCIYNIQVPRHLKILLVLHFFDLDTGYDKLELRQMVSGSNNIVAKLTGHSSTARNYTSEENRFSLLFTSNHITTRRGFRASYRAIHLECGGLFTGSSGSFTSPGYPDNYPNNVTCIYAIEVPKSMKIVLTIHSFDLETNFDKLQLRHTGRDGRFVIVTEFTGSNSTARNLTSPRNIVLLYFMSDASLTRRGFMASYRTIPVCGGVFTELNGSFNSPDYPHEYPNNANCTYDIQVPENMKILLVIHFFSMQTNADKLELRQMVSGSDNFVARLTGFENTARNYTSDENRFTLLFTSDDRYTYRGFQATYHAIQPACQPELYTSPSGDIKSPGYPNHYHNNANCVYNITVENGKRIRIHFSAFDVEDANGHCPYDQLMIFDGDSMDPTGTFCGSGAGTLTSRGNKLFMRFTTNGLVTKRGFFARYQTVDGPQGDVGTVNDVSDKDATLNWMMRNKNKQ